MTSVRKHVDLAHYPATRLVNAYVANAVSYDVWSQAERPIVRGLWHVLTAIQFEVGAP